jgi:hypothetical protein
MDAITMNRLRNANNNDDSEDFKLPPANKNKGAGNQIKVKRNKSNSNVGSKHSQRDRGDVQYLKNNTFLSKQSNDYENVTKENMAPVPNQMKSVFDDDVSTSGLTEEQELAVLKEKMRDVKKELENRNEIVTALQRNFEGLSMFCK